MHPKFACPICGDINTWPEYTAGNQLRCPRCRMSFTAPDSLPEENDIPTLEVANAKPIPTLEAVESDEDATPDDALDVIPVGQKYHPEDSGTEENEDRSLPVPQLNDSVWIIANS